jgi:hypothetical protein
MQMEQVGTQEAEKDFTFITPLDHGYSYKLANPHHPEFKELVVNCIEYLDRSIKRSNNSRYVTAVDFALNALEKRSDFWVSANEAGAVFGAFLIGKAEYPQSVGVYFEALAGELNYEHGLPYIEDYYRNLGYQFVEITGRRGWVKALEPQGYEFKNVTIVKRL